MTAVVKRVGPEPPLKATRSYRYIEPMPAGLNDNRLKWREKPVEQPKKAKPKAVAKPKKKTKPKPAQKQGKYRKWSFDEKEDIARRYWHGENWVSIAKDYGATTESVRAVCNRWTGHK